MVTRLEVKQKKNRNNDLGQVSFLDYSEILENKFVALQSRKVSLKNKSISELDIIIKNINLSEKKVAMASQVHSDKICWVDEPRIYYNCDGLITKKKIPLIIQTADCVPVFIVDIKKDYCALIHSGWRGTYKKIVLKAINELIINGSKIEDLNIILGASILECCYEVGKEFFNLFNKNCLFKMNGKIYFSNSKQIKTDLVDLGLDNNQIFISNECTFEDNSLCSFRRDGKLAGRMFSILMKG